MTRTWTQPWQGAIVVLRGLAAAADLVLRDPRGDEMGPVAGQLGDLLDQVRELVELAALGGREMAERAAVGAGAEVARRQPADDVFSGVAQGPHQSQPKSASSARVVAPLMNAHISPMGLRQNDARLRSVITGKPFASSKRIVCCIRVRAAGPCRVGTGIPELRMRSSSCRYCESGSRVPGGR